MKTMFLTSMGLFMNVLSYSQTNTFPANGNVGIGTLNPGAKLELIAGTNQRVQIGAVSGFAQPFDMSAGGAFISFSRPEDGSLAHAIYSYNSPGSVKNNLAMGSRSDIVFLSGNGGPGAQIERMRIAENGNIGIGTSSPNSLLTIKTNNDLSPDGIRLTGMTYGGYTKLSSGDAIDGVLSSYYHQFKIAMKDFQNGELVAFQTQIANGQLTAAFPYSNVGIGITTPPEAKLHINGSGGNLNGAAAIVLSDENSYGSRRWSISNGAGGNATDLIGKLVFSVGSGSYTANPMNGVSAMVLNTSGYLGVGVTNPTEKLSVYGNAIINGNVTAKKIIVTQTGWSDYVFNNDYKLRSLPELDIYIKQNKHLPGVPSTKGIKEKGISLGDTQALLLKKIEELTLYVIELKKEILDLQKHKK